MILVTTLCVIIYNNRPQVLHYCVHMLHDRLITLLYQPWTETINGKQIHIKLLICSAFPSCLRIIEVKPLPLIQQPLAKNGARKKTRRSSRQISLRVGNRRRQEIDAHRFSTSRYYALRRPAKHHAVSHHRVLPTAMAMLSNVLGTGACRHDHGCRGWLLSSVQHTPPHHLVPKRHALFLGTITR
jgi:hypothetical protein